MQTDGNNNQFAFFMSGDLDLNNDSSYFCETEKPLFMFHYMTSTEFHKRIEDDLLEQRRIVTSSKEAAAAFIDSLGIRHLLVPMTEEEIKAAEEKRAKAKQ